MTPDSQSGSPNSNLAWGLRYITLPWKVIPVHPEKKFPIDPHTGRALPGWPALATTDEATIRHWFSTTTNVGVGIATGRGSGIVVVDIDNKPGKDGETGLRLLEAALGKLPKTLEAETPSGGRHLIFSYPTGIDAALKNATNLGEHLVGRETFVDIRGDGGQINVEPTRRSAGSYCWTSEPEHTDLAELPARWVEYLLGGLDARPAPMEPSIGKIHEGSRNDRLTSYLGGLRAKGLEEEELVALARQWNNDNCVPLLDSVEVERTARGICRYPANTADHWTERGHAELFVKQNANDIRYTPEEDWLIWDGKAWKRDVKDIEINHRLMKLADHVRQQVENIPAGEADFKDAGRKWIKKIESAATITNCTKLSRSMPEVRATIDQFDANPNLFACSNAVIDLTTGEVRPHQRNDMITKMSPVVFDATATAPRWEAFLDRVFNSNRELIDFVQRTAGYCLTGLNREHRIWCAYGSGRNGKGVFFSVLRSILGPYAVTPSRDLFIVKTFGGIPNDLAALRSARMCVCDEFPTDKHPNEELLKQVSGGDRVSARLLHHEFFEFEPTFKVFLVTNQRLKFRASSLAFWSRFQEIPFEVTIPEEERNENLKEELIREEASGILNWMIAGARLYFDHGLKIPQIVRSATDAAQREADSVAAFMGERTIQAPEAETSARLLLSGYQSWCTENSFEPVSSSEFRRALTDRFGLIQRKTAACNLWRGVRLDYGVNI